MGAGMGLFLTGTLDMRHACPSLLRGAMKVKSNNGKTYTIKWRLLWISVKGPDMFYRLIFLKGRGMEGCVVGPKCRKFVKDLVQWTPDLLDRGHLHTAGRNAYRCISIFNWDEV